MKRTFSAFTFHVMLLFIDKTSRNQHRESHILAIAENVQFLVSEHGIALGEAVVLIQIEL